jgi:oligo-1,6-glucosidase
MVDDNNKQIFAYTRKSDHEQLLVVLNFSDKQAVLNTDMDVNKSTILISNYKKPYQNNYFEPYAAVIYKMEI